MKIAGIELKWLGHSAFLISNEKNIYIDPYNITHAEPKADIILITHSHYDHCSIADIQKIIKNGTKIIIPPDCQSKITKMENVEMQVVEPGDEIKLGNITINTIPSYNPKKQFHPKSECWLGYIVKMNNIIIYHAGDTDIIPEMEKLTGYGKKDNEFIALLPVGGNYTMNAEEAAQAASIIRPSLAIPMHYGSVAGTKEDAEKFIKLCKEAGINAEMLEKG